MKALYLVLAFICLIIGMVGVVIPILPTFPFLLLATFLFYKSSGKIYKWFINTSIYKKYLESFQKNKSMTLKTKVIILIPVTLLIGIAIYCVNNVAIKIILFLIIILKYYYFIVKIKTISNKKK